MFTTTNQPSTTPPEKTPAELEAQLIPNNLPQLVQRLVTNRERLAGMADMLGLSTNYLEQLASEKILVGFAEQNFPAPTLFPGGVEEMRQSAQLSLQIVRLLEAAGLEAELNLLLPLEWDSVVANGYAACDYLLLPKNPTENKKAPLLGGKAQRGETRMTAYIEATISEEILAKIKKDIADSCMSSRKSIQPNVNEPAIPTNRLLRAQILQAITEDLDLAFAESGGNYYNFISIFNLIFTKRLLGFGIPSTPVDQNLNRFLRYGIADPSLFFRQLARLGFNLDQEVLKMVNSSGQMIGIQLGLVDGVTMAANDEIGIVPLTELLESTPVYPKKELSYFIEMAGLLPQIYLDDNQKIYEPYFDTLRFLQKLGLEPVMFPYRERLELGINESVTVLDFYGYILLKQES